MTLPFDSEHFFNLVVYVYPKQIFTPPPTPLTPRNVYVPPFHRGNQTRLPHSKLPQLEIIQEFRVRIPVLGRPISLREADGGGSIHKSTWTEF